MSLHSTRRSLIPTRGTPNDVHYAVNTGEVFWVAGNGDVLCITDWLKGKTIHVCSAGGRDGKDSVVPGPQGPKGEPGNVLYVGPEELRAATEKARQELLSRRATVQAAIEQHRLDAKRLTPGVRAVLFSALNDVERANNA